MKISIKERVLAATGATKIINIQKVQNLWSGYGSIERINLKGAKYSSVILKHIQLPKDGKHPRGWNTDLSHQRKVKSYQVEINWYERWNMLTDQYSRTAKCLDSSGKESEVFLILEDLDASGYPARLQDVEWKQIEICLSWLANFHAKFLNETITGLWETGTYWHLETRPDELRVLDDKRLKQIAPQIDHILKESPYQTLVHGDAKIANFCFSSDSLNVAAVDFQYVGGGCGMKDVAYFIGSCFYEHDCERLEEEVLKYYFNELKRALIRNSKDINFSELEKSWRHLYRYAWCDFHRFLKGWSPDHWKINSYSEKITREVLDEIESRSD